uniref:Short-chain-enoyl-CoA hydratase n=1 Tax=uncultured Dehalococcoidia bacterium TaxID=498747 RepID=A0A871YCA1_9CHLR|nr:Short-chain-enoyl-CoA hydratase [uncultured Dehalococcoidia bacterium]
MGEFQTLLFEKQNRIASITLNRPRALNTYNLQMRDEMYQILEAIASDTEISVVVLKGTGEKGFCAGADLSEFLTAPSPIIAREIRWLRDVWGHFLKLPQPLIAAVHGFVMGSGVEMTLCSDIRIATEDARFGLPETRLGLIPVAGATQTLPREAGYSAAADILFSARTIDAPEALRIGLINRIVTREKLYPTAYEMAESIASRNPACVRRMKQAVMRGLDLNLPKGLQLERSLASLH